MKKESPVLTALRNAYGKIETMNPDGETYKELIDYLDGLEQPMLKMLAKSEIKWVSMLARNRVKVI